MNENEHYNENYTEQEIDDLLLRIKSCVNRNKFTVEQNENRQENKKLIENYNLSHSKIKTILLNIETRDFCHSLQNKKIGYEHEILYVFCPQRILFNIFGEEEFVDIYTKFNIIEYDDNNNTVYTVSFHKRNKPINYIFR